MDKVRTALLVLLGVLVGVAAAVFVYDNDTPVVLFFLTRQTDPVPLWLLVALAALGGAVIPRLLGLGRAWRRFWDRRQVNKRVAELEAEVVRLRNIPLQALPDEEPELTREPERRRRPRQLPPPAARREPGAYEAFLAHGEGFDAVEQESLYGQLEGPAPSTDPEDVDPYALAFDAEDPAIAELEEGELFPAVVEPGDDR